MKVLVTGGAGFIGSAVVRHLTRCGIAVVNVDKLTYAGNLESIAECAEGPDYQLERVDICNPDELERIFAQHRPSAVIHLAAESHVDRSIDGPSAFIETNVVGTYQLLETAHRYWSRLTPRSQSEFRFLHVSTDEVYGSLGPDGLFTEESCYRPNSPYSASKASADHLARAWFQTYGFPVLTTNCSNNYGPFQFPEKLIPLMVLNALDGRSLPVYGQGENVRDWLFVEDHVRALETVLTQGRPGEVYNIGGNNEMTNLQVVKTLCNLLDELLPHSPFQPHAQLITHVTDRPGHDLRYAIDAGKIERELNWRPQETFESGLRKTVLWYLHNQEWCKRVQEGSYRRERLGLKEAETP